ncbi:hypothetical protein [Phosphitispora fastidiosa]|uniref:hypothetical protein n=1 Tax=Phosphitispora fastidiosa TaxID=2837202 RepID=UPI001E3DC5A2|nr:hypothetical protein [Phosphitispora fastidiosa]MBU7005618.1 hypothetical protein [Phosphitispora fastidiosa]
MIRLFFYLKAIPSVNRRFSNIERKNVSVVGYRTTRHLNRLIVSGVVSMDAKNKINEDKKPKRITVPMVIQGRSFRGKKFTIEDVMLYILEDALKNERTKQSM